MTEEQARRLDVPTMFMVLLVIPALVLHFSNVVLALLIGGGGAGGKPSGSSSSKPSSDSSVTKNNSAKSPSSGVSSGGYGFRHGALSNFFLWAWIFHDFDDDDYEEEYGGSNAGFGGWAIIGVGAIAIFFLGRNLRNRFSG